MLENKQISIIICSRNTEISEELKRNIDSTIGVEYEMVFINNKHAEYDIFTAYTEGLKHATCEYLCYMHEDVYFHSVKWGQCVLDHFKDKTIGVLGVMGGHYIPNTPSGWWEPGVTSENFICRFPDGTCNKVYIDKYRNDAEGVVAVDGAFMCFPRRIFDEISWDSNLFTGFHCYDIDICLQAITHGYKVQIAWDILLEHRSTGSFDRKLIKSRHLLYNKWQNILPIQRGVYMTNEEVNIHHELARLRESVIEINNSLEFKLGKMLISPIRRIHNLFR